MLAKAARLRSSEFREFIARGKRFTFPELSIVYTPHTTFHASVVVSKKVAKRAVLRNALRRRVYAVLYRLLKQTGRTGVYVIYLRPAAAQLPRRALNATVAERIATVLKKT